MRTVLWYFWVLDKRIVLIFPWIPLTIRLGYLKTHWLAPIGQRDLSNGSEQSKNVCWNNGPLWIDLWPYFDGMGIEYRTSNISQAWIIGFWIYLLMDHGSWVSLGIKVIWSYLNLLFGWVNFCACLSLGKWPSGHIWLFYDYLFDLLIS